MDISEGPMHRLIFSACALVACAKQPLTTESTTAAQRSAEAVGAEEVPQAALALQLSKEHLAHALELYDQGDEDEAKSMLTRAEADAELAAALAKAADEKALATAAMDEVRKVQSAH
jgi:hypothetical protein